VTYTLPSKSTSLINHSQKPTSSTLRSRRNGSLCGCTWPIRPYELPISKSEHGVRLTLLQIFRRLFYPTTLFTNRGPESSPWDIDRPERLLALVVYIFEEDVVKNKRCSVCAKPRGPSPMRTCLIPKGDILRGSCTNCHYHGNGLGCSHARGKGNLTRDKLPRMGWLLMDVIVINHKKRVDEEEAAYPYSHHARAVRCLTGRRVGAPQGYVEGGSASPGVAA
jgi:hypothetical protein